MKPKRQPRATLRGRTARARSLSWSRAALIRTIKAGTIEERLASLKRAGIVTKDGKLSQRYQRWGKGITMTPDLLGPDDRQQT